ncbi:MAG: amidohydrolase family protein, partial [Candidatus Pacebacteria bacterium]|nr:amidohydrolase family protein [Candidatus Paceibacterota bacterium]
TMNPIEGIYVAVTRHTADGKNPNGLIPEEKLTVEEAVQCYTMNAAYASYQEKKVGSIEPGKFADLVILSENIFEIDPIKIRDAKVITTVFDGEIIYTIN